MISHCCAWCEIVVLKFCAPPNVVLSKRHCSRSHLVCSDTTFETSYYIFFFCKRTLILQSFSNCVVMNVTFIMLRNVESAMYLFHFLLLLWALHGLTLGCPLLGRLRYFVNTHPNVCFCQQQTANISAFMEVLTLAPNQLIKSIWWAALHTVL